MLLWPLLILIGFTERSSKRGIAAIGATGIIVVLLYLKGYRTPAQHSDPLVTILHPFRALRYLGVYMFAPVALAWRPISQVAAGVGCCLLACLAAADRMLAYRQGRRPLEGFFAYTMLFIMGTAIITALGRANFELWQAASFRYRTPVYLFWVSAAGIVSSILNRQPSRRISTLGTPALCVAIFALVLLPLQSEAVYSELHWAQDLRRASLAVVLDVPDERAWYHVSFDRDLARRNLAFLREHHLSLFAEPFISSVGRPIADGFKMAAAGRCSGSFAGVIPIPSASPDTVLTARVFGSGSEDPAGEAVQQVLVADEKGRIVGLAYGAFPRVNHLSSYQEPTPDSWAGYIRAPAGTKSLTAFGILPKEGAVCVLGKMTAHQGS
jgi:hypothetical protein